MASLNERDRIIKDEVFHIRLLSIAIGLIHDLEDSKDVVQDVLLDLIQKSEEQIKAISNIESFVVQMVKNQGITSFKRRVKTRARTVPLEEIKEEGNFIDPVFKLHFTEVENAINKKNNPAESLIFNLHFRNGNTDKEISQLTGKKAGNIRKKISEIRKWAKTYFINEKR